MSFSVIAMVWIASLIFALPMGMVYHFDYHEENYRNGTEWATNLKPFCSIEFLPNSTLGLGPNSTLITEHMFKYYRY